MPRTKRTNSSAERSRREAFMLDFKRKTSLELKKLEVDVKERMNKALATIDSEFQRFSPEYHNLTLGEICDLLNGASSSSEEEVEDISVVEKSDAGYATGTSSTMSIKTSSYTGKLKPGPASKKLQMSSNIYLHTPKDRVMKVVPITPKVGPNAPVPVTRYARAGETVLSMTGSPILAPGVCDIRVPNVSVPLDNGDVINIAPTASLRQSILPTLDPSTVDYLRKLKEQIEKFLPHH